MTKTMWLYYRTLATGANDTPLQTPTFRFPQLRVDTFPANASIFAVATLLRVAASRGTDNASTLRSQEEDRKRQPSNFNKLT